jgi:hypothetical protein
VPLAYLRRLVAVLATYLIVATLAYWLGPDQWMPVSFGSLWRAGYVLTALRHVWFLFGWAVAVTLVVGVLAIMMRTPRLLPAGTVLWRGNWVSLNAGVFEELIWRGFGFCVAMFFLKLLSVIPLVGWFFHILYGDLLIPLADLTSLHTLHPQLSGNWIVAAAIVSSNASFRDEHAWLGWFGYVNSWFVGIVMFWLVFHYGMVSAMAAHVLYDMLALSTGAVLSAFWPRIYYR